MSPDFQYFYKFTVTQLRQYHKHNFQNIQLFTSRLRKKVDILNLKKRTSQFETSFTRNKEGGI